MIPYSKITLSICIASMFALLSCKKDTLTSTPLEPAVVASDCGDVNYALNVDSVLNSIFLAPIPVVVCVCDTLNLSLSNIASPWSFVDHVVFGPSFQPITISTDPELELMNPLEDTWIFSQFENGLDTISTYTVVVEDIDCQ